MKLISIISIATVALLSACSSIQIQSTVATIEKDIPGWWTGLKALETSVGTVLTSQAFDNLLAAFKVNPQTALDIKTTVGVANSDVAVTQDLLNVVIAQVKAAQAGTVTTP